MNSSHKRPPPLCRPKHRQRCPVCHEVSYSAAGIHPQCAARLADPNFGKSRVHLKTTEEPSNSNALKGWQKTCRRCGAVNHVRQKICACGHPFAGTSS